ncbi:hypothetical protein MNBD_GAMMA05-625 [hydrothermal vent metagenome]|uniref:Alkaline phosphodiesterase I / Nucleotide pyrophosphatase n=1 Tax=hydrothermal vent metagenome TaxID=652676 RepID=A0A3B0WIF7_9ZZZZ
MPATRDNLVILIMIDALRHDYINKKDAPFIHKLASEGTFGELQPSFGFEPDGAYFAGLHPEECDGGAQFWHNPNESLFHYTRLFCLLNVIAIPAWRKFLRKAIRAITQLKSHDSLTKRMATSAYIPFYLLKHFSTPMKKISSEPGFMPTKSIFDLTRENKKDFYFHGFPQYKVHTNTVLERFLSEDISSNSLAFLFFGDLDSKGHVYGPNSDERKSELKNIDHAVQEIFQHAKKTFKSVDVVIFGDHGMVETKSNINLTTIINKYFNNDSPDKYFLDSTLARFWVSDIEKRKQLTADLNNISGGHVINDSEKSKLHINYKHNYFGDIIYATDCGNLIHPSFYSDGAAPKGMHGYLEGCTDNESFFVAYGSNVEKKGHVGKHDMREIFPTILELMNIPLPSTTDKSLKSILQY